MPVKINAHGRFGYFNSCRICGIDIKIVMVSAMQHISSQCGMGGIGIYQAIESGSGFVFQNFHFHRWHLIINSKDRKECIVNEFRGAERGPLVSLMLFVVAEYRGTVQNVALCI